MPLSACFHFFRKLPEHPADVPTVNFATGIPDSQGVPEFLFQGLMLASSKGQFFRTRIVGRYPYREV